MIRSHSPNYLYTCTCTSYAAYISLLRYWRKPLTISTNGRDYLCTRQKQQSGTEWSWMIWWPHQRALTDWSFSSICVKMFWRFPLDQRQVVRLWHLATAHALRSDAVRRHRWLSRARSPTRSGLRHQGWYLFPGYRSLRTDLRGPTPIWRRCLSSEYYLQVEANCHMEMLRFIVKMGSLCLTIEYRLIFYWLPRAISNSMLVRAESSRY